MKNQVYKLNFLILAIIILAFFSACKQREGCTDPQSLTYDSEAVIDDGSCEYARDKFLGTYTGTNVCSPTGFWESDNFVFTIRKHPSDIDKIEVRFPYQRLNSTQQPPLWCAEAIGNTLYFDKHIRLMTSNGPYLCNNANGHLIITLQGTATLNEDKFSLPFRYSVITEADQIEHCVVSCTVEAVKNF